MKRSQAVYRTLPPRQASHALFVGEIVGKYGGMQRNAGKLPLTHRLAAFSDRKRQPTPKSAPLQVQIVLPHPTPGPARVIERERPAYRDRPATAVTQANPESAKPNRAGTTEPPKERVIEREKVIERERLIERKEIVERERVVEKKVVIVRDVERIIREQRILREQAVKLPIRGSADARSAADVHPKQRFQGSTLIHTQGQALTDRFDDRDGMSMGVDPETGSIGQIPAERTDSPDKRRDRQAGRASGHLTAPDRPRATSSRALVPGDYPTVPAMGRQSWPLLIAKKSGWRTPAESVLPEKGNLQAHAKPDRRSRRKKQNAPQSPTPLAAKAKSSVPGITLINRKTRRTDGKSERPQWRLSSALPSQLRERPTSQGTARTQAGFGVPAGNHANSYGESETRGRPIVSGRAVIASPSRLRNDKPEPYRFVQSWKNPDSPVDPSGQAPSAPSMTLAQLWRNGNRRQEGTAAKPAFLQGEALQRRTIPLAWSSRPASEVAALPGAQSSTPHFGQDRREMSVLGQSGRKDSDETAEPAPIRGGEPTAESGQRWIHPRTVHIRRGVAPDAYLPNSEIRAHVGHDAESGNPESSGSKTQAAVPGKAAIAAMQDAEPTAIGQEAKPTAIAQGGGAAEIVRAKLMRSDQPERAPTVHVRREGSRAPDADVQTVNGTIKRTRRKSIDRHERNPTRSSGMPIARFVKSESSRAADGSGVQRERDSRAASLTEDRGMRNATRQLKPLINLNRIARTRDNPSSRAADKTANGNRPPLSDMDSRGTEAPGRNVRGTVARGMNVPETNVRGTIAKGMNAPDSTVRGTIVPGSIVQRVRAQRSNAESSRTPGADTRILHPSAAGAQGLNGSVTIAQAQAQATVGRNMQQSIPMVNVAQDGSVQQRDVPPRETAVWRAGRADRQQRTDRPEQGASPRAVSAMVQRRQDLTPPGHGQGLAGGQPLPPRLSQAGRPPSSRQSAAAIAMQPSAPIFGVESFGGVLHQSASRSGRISAGMTPTERSSANAQSRISHRLQSVHQRGHAAAFGSQQQATQARANTLAALRPNGPAADEPAFAAVPLAYASAQTGAAAASAGHVPPAAAIPGSAAATPMEFRRQQAPPPATPAQEASPSPSAVKAAIDPEQLQQAISKLPMLNPDQIADQVYKAIARRMKFEQRLQGY